MQFSILIFVILSILFSNITHAEHGDSEDIHYDNTIQPLIDDLPKVNGFSLSQVKKNLEIGAVATVVVAGLTWFIIQEIIVDSEEKYARYNEVINGKGIRVNSIESDYRFAILPNHSSGAVNKDNLNFEKTKNSLNILQKKLLVFEYDF